MLNPTHEHGPYYVSHGSMYFKDNNFFLDEDIAILVDIDEDGTGTLLKVGKTKSLQDYFNTAANKYKALGYSDLISTWKLISFNIKFDAIPELNLPEFAPEGHNLTVDDICTIINWFMNCSCQNMGKFFSLSKDDLRTQIDMLQKVGY